MNRINVNQASREELIEIVKQLRQQLRPAQATALRVGELEEQVVAQRRELAAHNETIRALTLQSEKLSEKSASDEETISALIQQLEGQWQQHSQPSGEGIVEGNVLVARTVKLPSQIALPQRCAPGAKGLAVAAGQASDTGDGWAANTPRNDEIAQLEAKVRELTEVNAFYATILSQRDEEERRQAKAASPAAEVAEAEASQRRHDVERERDTLQHAARQLTQANAKLEAELQGLREELTRMELDLVAAEQWRAAQCNGAGAEALPIRTPAELPLLLHADAAIPHGLSSSPSPARTLAQPVAPIQYRISGSNNSGKAAAKGRARNWSVASPLADTASSPFSHALPHAEVPSRASLRRGLLDIEALPEIRLGNPTRQEKLLLERLELFQRHVEDMQAHEYDRQRSFDEMERTRAEFFTGMNERLEAQRREIQQLKRRVAETHTQGPVPAPTPATIPIAKEKADAACSPIASLASSASDMDASPVELREETRGISETAGDVPNTTTVEEKTETVHDDKEEQAEHAEEEEEERESQRSNVYEAELLRQLESPSDDRSPPHGDTSAQLEREEECARLHVMNEAADIFARIVACGASVMSRAAATAIADAAKRAKEEAAEQADREAKATRSLTAALACHERWEPLRCLSEAYGDVVDAQRALLHLAVRPTAVSHSVSATTAKERQQALAALDAALTLGETTARRNGNEREREDDRPSSCTGSGASREATPSTGGEKREPVEVEVEVEWKGEGEKNGQQTPSGQGRAEVPSWWDTSSAAFHVDAMSPETHSSHRDQKSGSNNNNHKRTTTMTASESVAMEPRQEVKNPFAFCAAVVTPSGDASAVTTGLQSLDFFSTTAFAAVGGKPGEETPSFVAEFDPFA